MPTYTKTRNMDSLFDFLTSCLTRTEGPCLWSPLHLPNPNNCPSPLRCLYVPAIQLFSPCLERLNACMIETHTGTLTRCLYLPGMPMEPHLCLVLIPHGSLFLFGLTPWNPIFVRSYPMEPHFCTQLPGCSHHLDQPGVADIIKLNQTLGNNHET